MSGRGDVERDSRLLVNGGARPFSCSGYLRPSALTEAISKCERKLVSASNKGRRRSHLLYPLTVVVKNDEIVVRVGLIAA
jgi:hypothetical protein